MVFGEAPERVREQNVGISIHGDVTGRKWHKSTARTGQGKPVSYTHLTLPTKLEV